jgi:CRP-like cAMP-binding protein/SAM-dependent methyltransferase
VEGFLQYLTGDDERLLLEKASDVSVAVHEVLLGEGSRRQALFLLRDGTVRVERAHLGQGVAIARLGPGSIFGEMSFLESGPASASVVAETPARVAVVEGRDVQSLIGSVPGFGTRFYQSLAVMLSGRLRDAAALLPPLLVEEVPQVSRFHASRASGTSGDAIPPRLVAAVETFKSAMLLADRQILSRGVGETEAQSLVGDACSLLSDELRHHVEQESHLEAEIGAYVFRETFSLFMQSPLLDRSFSKPRGYAGDYETIDLIYRNEPHGIGRLGPRVDRWALDLASSSAVRNRREMMVRTIRSHASELDRPMRVTSLASGPARELFDIVADDGVELHALCIDIDPEALSHASARAAELGVADRFTFAQENVVRLMRGRARTEVEPQHLIYSLGLIDYFDDPLVVPLLDWIWASLEPGGLAVIGNFAADSPDKAFMDHVVEWRLIYRSPERLRELLALSRWGSTPVEIRHEEDGVQLFALARR